MSLDEIDTNLAGIQDEIEGLNLLDTAGNLGAIIENNATFYEGMDMLDFLREVGSRARMGPLLSKDSTSARLRSDGGMSFAEFSYPLLQAYDFLHLYREKNCRVQIGGSDQWGNIVAGTDLIGRTEDGASPIGITLKLITTKSGDKLGKSSGNAIWLSPHKTSNYDFLQYFLRVDDNDVERMLMALTHLPINHIKDVMDVHSQKPHLRVAQTKLGEAVVSMVRGQSAFASAEKASAYLFGDMQEDLTAGDVAEMANAIGARAITLQSHLTSSTTMLDGLVQLGLVASKSRARTLIKNGAVRVNKNVISDNVKTIDEALAGKRHAVVSAGKKQHAFLLLQ